VLLCSLGLGCGDADLGELPPVEGAGGSGVGSTSTGFVDTDPAVCGDEEHPVSQQNPTVYFVLDRSGSMDEPVGGGQTRWTRVRGAVFDMVDALGALVRVGAAVYPNKTADEQSPCLAGDEVYAPKLNPGSAFTNTLGAIKPFGGTPTSSTLEAVRARLADIPSPKAVILATDGAPNCNPNTSCGIEQCLPNVVGGCPIAPASCCAPPEGLPENCIDGAASLDAVAGLASDGVPVYVVGIPGTTQFATLLNQWALAGGTPQSTGDTLYFKVDALDELAGVFKSIAGSLVSCRFDLGAPPEGPGLTNLYFDGAVVFQDAENGWIWVDGDTIEVVGDACAELKNGGVSKVQIVSGCPTQTPE